jgi:hypothetical protein
VNPALDDLIDRFRAAQDVGVETLKKWGIPRPPSNRAWPFIWVEHKLLSRTEIDGIGVYAHGYGIELTIGGLVIDFDWGDNGEPDGFDVWRLYVFTLNNGGSPSVSYELVQSWIEEALAAGELIESGSLYYDPRRRSTTGPNVSGLPEC